MNVSDGAPRRRFGPPPGVVAVTGEVGGGTGVDWVWVAVGAGVWVARREGWLEAGGWVGAVGMVWISVGTVGRSCEGSDWSVCVDCVPTNVISTSRL